MVENLFIFGWEKLKFIETSREIQDTIEATEKIDGHIWNMTMN